MRRLLPLALAAAMLVGCSNSEPTASRPSSSATPDASERALAQPPPPMTAPASVEETKLSANSPWDFADGDAAYQAALLVLQALRQDPALLSSRKRTHADFAKILQLSTPDHSGWLEKRIAAFLRAQEDPADTPAAELGSDLQSALTLGLQPDGQDRPEGASPTPTPDVMHVRFRSYDPDAGAFGVLKVSHTAAYTFKPEGGGIGLAVAFDVVAPYNIISHEGTRQIVTVHITDFRMVMAEQGGRWLWNGFDMVDEAVSVKDAPPKPPR